MSAPQPIRPLTLLAPASETCGPEGCAPVAASDGGETPDAVSPEEREEVAGDAPTRRTAEPIR